MERQNCLEEVLCARREDCPAYPDHGRSSFAVTATLCKGEKQGSYDEKITKAERNMPFLSGHDG